MTRLMRSTVLGAAATTLILGQMVRAEAPSGFGCSEIETPTARAALPAIEGRDGVFFRTFADIRMQDPMDQRIVKMVGRLADVLAENGTTLLYVNVPTKAQSMQNYLSDRTLDYGFDPAIASAVYTDAVTRLNAAGVLAPDIMTALQNIDPQERAFFGADFHWTSAGARVAAREVARWIVADPGYAELTPQEFVTTPLAPQVAFSGMRRELQGYCIDTLPATETMAYKTERVAAEGGELDIFASAEDSLPAVLVGTSFSDMPISNFVGFLMQYTGLDIVNYAVTGGSQYGAITSYLTSDEFKAQRPRILIWENPIYTNLAQFGTAPLEELIAAAGTACTVPLQTSLVDKFTVQASLDGIRFGPQDALYAGYGAEGARLAQFSLATTDAITRTAKIERGPRLRGTGNFYLGMSAYRHHAYSTLTVRFDRPVSEKTVLTLCQNPKGDAS